MYVTFPHRSPTGQPQDEQLLILGETTFRKTHLRFGLLPEDRLRHVWLLGKTGSGKSTLLQNLITQDLRAGRGIGLLDPHGDLVDAVLPYVPPGRINQTLLFFPEDRGYPVSFNVFREGRALHRDPALLSSSLISIFKKHWNDSWGPRLEHVLRNAVLAVASRPEATLVYLYQFLTDEALRDKVIPTITDPVVRQFWLKEFPGYSKALQAEALAPVLNKLGAFVAHPIIRSIVGQVRSRVDVAALMDERGVILARLPTGAIGEDGSRLLGGLLLSAIQLAAMQRPRGGPPFYVYVDEFQSFTNDAVAVMLAEARKFGLGLVLAHQYLGQLPPTIQGALIGNIGTTILFRLGGSDALVLESEFTPPFTAYDLMNLERYHVVVKLLARGVGLTPFSARTLPSAPSTSTSDQLAKLVAQSRLRFCQDENIVRPAIDASLSARAAGPPPP